MWWWGGGGRREVAEAPLWREEIEACECASIYLSNKPMLMFIYAVLGRGKNCCGIIIRYHWGRWLVYVIQALETCNVCNCTSWLPPLQVQLAQGSHFLYTVPSLPLRPITYIPKFPSQTSDVKSSKKAQVMRTLIPAPNDPPQKVR